MLGVFVMMLIKGKLLRWCGGAGPAAMEIHIDVKINNAVGSRKGGAALSPARNQEHCSCATTGSGKRARDSSVQKSCHLLQVCSHFKCQLHTK